MGGGQRAKGSWHGDRVRKRDGRRLAGLHRVGELIAIAATDPDREAGARPVQTRGDMAEDMTLASRRARRASDANRWA
jgi:hypothetical protein